MTNTCDKHGHSNDVEHSCSLAQSAAQPTHARIATEAAGWGHHTPKKHVVDVRHRDMSRTRQIKADWQGGAEAALSCHKQAALLKWREMMFGELGGVISCDARRRARCEKCGQAMASMQWHRRKREGEGWVRDG